MDDTNEALFKQALIEGVNRRIDREIAACSEEIVYSHRHIKAMARILKGKATQKPINYKVVAILVVAAILLVGCAIIDRDDIRAFITDIKEFFVEIRFNESNNESKYIQEIYTLTYIPEGYILENQDITKMGVEYSYKNEEEKYIKFLQMPLDTSSLIVDVEHGDYSTVHIGQYEIYYRKTNETYVYVWNDGEYALKLNSTNELSFQLLELLINGIKTE